MERTKSAYTLVKSFNADSISEVETLYDAWRVANATCRMQIINVNDYYGTSVDPNTTDYAATGSANVGVITVTINAVVYTGTYVGSGVPGVYDVSATSGSGLSTLEGTLDSNFAPSVPIEDWVITGDINGTVEGTWNTVGGAVTGTATLETTDTTTHHKVVYYRVDEGH